MNSNNHGRHKQVCIEPIGVVHSCFTEKFGIPRQPGMVVSATAVLELLKPYNREEMVRGLEQFSHVWLVFQFHGTVVEGWKPTVRPPWLGGKQRVGVFACRSPHRPNHLGLSVVRLVEVKIEPGSVKLHLAGIDLLDGTPVFDIKPYVPYSDSISTATCGYADGGTPDQKVDLLDGVREFCTMYQQATGHDLKSLIIEIIAGDPRPASQKQSRKDFGMLLWNVNVRWRIEADGSCVVFGCEVINKSRKP